MMLVSKEDIPKGSEFTVNYGYPFATAPLWYKKLVKQYVANHNSSWKADKAALNLSENVDILSWNALK